MKFHTNRVQTMSNNNKQFDKAIGEWDELGVWSGQYFANSFITIIKFDFEQNSKS